MPSFLFGTFYFTMIFSDRILSWIFNPMTKVAGLPMEFNSVYHAGADLALIVLLSTSIIQYVLMSPLYIQIGNMTLNHKNYEVNKITLFLQQRYRQLLTMSVISAAVTAIVLNFAASSVIFHAGGSQISIQVLRIASVSNIFFSIFAVNSLFIVFLNRIKIIAAISMAGTSIIVITGPILAQSGFENIVFAYLGATIMAAITSTFYAKKIMKNAGAIFFSKYV